MRGCTLLLLACHSQLRHELLDGLAGVLLAVLVRVRRIGLDRLNDRFRIVSPAERNFRVGPGYGAAGIILRARLVVAVILKPLDQHRDWLSAPDPVLRPPPIVIGRRSLGRPGSSGFTSADGK